MPLTLRSPDVVQILETAEKLAIADGSELASRHDDWYATFKSFLSPKCPLNYFPILLVTLVARTASSEVNVKRIQRGADYSASLVGQRLVEFARNHQIDVRTDSTNIMNAQPFVRRSEITADLSESPWYPQFFEAVEKVQKLISQEAAEILGLGLFVGRQNWPERTRRSQKNQHVHPTGSPGKPAEAYFILNQSPHQDFAHYDGDDYYGFHENVTSASQLVNAGHGRFVFYNTSDANESPMHFVAVGEVVSIEETGADEQGRRTWRALLGEVQPFDVPVSKTDGAPGNWNSQNSIIRITAEEFSRIVSLGSAEPALPKSLALDDLREACDEYGLLLPDQVLVTLLAAVDSGKHVILTGPPGTAKTTLATVLARLATEKGLSRGHVMTTATADWSTYDTIGGLTPTSDGALTFRRGSFLQALESDRWLVVDELNRSNFDRAFGQLFTVLAGEDVALPYQDAASGRTLRIRHEHGAADAEYHDIVMKRSWRMLATMNNFDKSLLFEMSFALMRRFAFVEVPVPPDADYRRLTEKVLEGETIEVTAAVRQVMDALMPMRRIKEIGPAIFIDAARMARSMASLASVPVGDIVLRVFYAMLLPQFEGVEESEGKRLAKLLTHAVGAERSSEAARILREVLGLDLGLTLSNLADSDDVGDGS